MKKFRKGDKIVARKAHSATGDRSFMSGLSEVLHVAPFHYVIKAAYGFNHIMSFEDIADRQFVKATKKMIELMTKEAK